MSKINIIQLDWESDKDEPGWLEVDTPFGTFTIYYDEEVDNYDTGNDNYPHIGDSFNTLEEAKQDLQEWFENLVKDVLKNCIVDQVSD